MKRFIAGPVKYAMERLSRSLTSVSITTPKDKQGNRGGSAHGVPAAGVRWPVDPQTHDGAAFIVADTFYAYYDAKTKQAICLDDLDATAVHTGALPLTLGNDLLTLQPEMSGLGRVVRSAEYGTAGLDKNIFIHDRGPLNAHHVPPDEPTLSSIVEDGDSGRKAGLHGPVRVTAWANGWCNFTGSTAPLMALVLNATRSGGDNSGWLAMYFEQTEAVGSMEAGGPIGHAGPKDTLLGGTPTSDNRDIRPAALNIGEFGLFTVDMQDSTTGPLDWEPDEDPDCADVGFPHRVHFRADRDKKRKNFCGDEVKLVHRWHVRIPMVVEPDCRAETGDVYGIIHDPTNNANFPNIKPNPSAATPFRLDSVALQGRGTPYLATKGKP